MPVGVNLTIFFCGGGDTGESMLDVVMSLVGINQLVLQIGTQNGAESMVLDLVGMSFLPGRG